MTRAEILSEIKRAEDESKNLVAQANEARNQSISEAKAKAREIIRQAEEEALSFAGDEMGRARETIKEEREKLLEKGALSAEELKKKAKKNVAEATKFILTEFERAAANA